MKQIVFYHANCMDGTGAALAHQWAFENIVADFVYQPINYPQASDENKFAEFLQKKEIQLWGVSEIWFLDFTPTLPVLQFLLKLGIKIFIIDHHATGVEMLQEIEAMEPRPALYDKLYYVTGDSDEFSGAYLTHLFQDQLFRFAGMARDNDPIKLFHRLPNRIGDSVIVTNLIGLETPHYQTTNGYNLLRVRDCWDTRNKELKAYADGFHYYCFHHGIPDHPDKLAAVFKNEDLTPFIKEGQVIKSVYEKQCQKAIDTGLQTVVNTDLLDDIQVLITVAPYDQASLLGEMWYSKFPERPAISIGLFYNHGKATGGYGIRSNHLVNSRLIAQAVSNGGGHDRASGGPLTEVEMFSKASDSCIDLSEILYEVNQLFIDAIMKVYKQPKEISETESE